METEVECQRAQEASGKWKGRQHTGLSTRAPEGRADLPNLGSIPVKSVSDCGLQNKKKGCVLPRSS